MSMLYEEQLVILNRYEGVVEDEDKPRSRGCIIYPDTVGICPSMEMD